MSSGIVRIGDNGTGHGGFPPRPSSSGSSSVFVNGIGVVRVGDTWVTHCDPHSCHSSFQLNGSSSVFVNGRAIARIGDDIACGSKNRDGSGNVFSG